jgi:NADH:quinone reductase (non-electrogenic)
MSERTRQRVLILGGGFAGVNTAAQLERLLADRPEVEITLVSRDNYTLFTPMLAEVAASGIEPGHIVNAVRAFLKRTTFREGVVTSIDLAGRRVATEHPNSHAPATLEFDRLVIALGSVTNYRNVPGVAEHAFALKTMADAQEVRDQVLSVLEQAALIESPAARACLLTFVIAGGGFSGAELCGALQDYIARALRFYPTIEPSEIRIVLVHPGPTLLPEVSAELGEYARGELERRRVEVLVNTKVTAATAHSVTLGDGETLLTHTLVWTAGTAPSPVLSSLTCPRDGRGAVIVDPYLEVAEWPGVFALGDCALVPDGRSGTFYPPTAQHAIREAKTAAINLAASLGVGEKEPFEFDAIGALAVLGHRTAVAEIKGRRFAGFSAWWLWRTVYWSKLPRWDRRARVALDWTLDLFFPADTVQLGAGRMHLDELDDEGVGHDGAAPGTERRAAAEELLAAGARAAR